MKVKLFDWERYYWRFDCSDWMAAKAKTLPSGERSTHKQWSSESMEAAVKSVRGGMGASRLHNVPVVTLRRRVIGIVEIDC